MSADFPPEIWDIVFEYLDLETYIGLVRVCCLFREMVYDEVLSRKKRLAGRNEKELFIKFATYGFVEGLELIHQIKKRHYLDIYAQAINAAAENGHYECMELLYNYGAQWSSKTLQVAVEGGHIRCLKYALNNGCPKSLEVVYTAVNLKRIGCLRLLHNAGAPWDLRICHRLTSCLPLGKFKIAYRDIAESEGIIYDHGCPLQHLL